MFLVSWLSSSVLLASLAAVIAGYTIATVLSYYRLKHIPGPTAWAWIRFPLIHAHVTGDIYDQMGDLSDKYGSLVRIGPNYLLSSDPDVLRRMSAPRSPYRKSNWYITARLTPGVDNMLSDRNDRTHDLMRKKTLGGYTGKENVRLESEIDECLLDFMDLIDRKYIGTDANPVQMQLAQKVSFFTCDVTSKVAFDTKFNDLRDDNDNYGYCEELATMFPRTFCTCIMPELIDFLTKIGFLQWLNNVTGGLALNKVVELCKTQAALRFDADGKPKDIKSDMMGIFVKNGLTHKQVEEESILALTAGTDTTASAIRATMRGLLTTPHAIKKLTQELDEAMRLGTIPSGYAEVISDAQSKQLPYLQAVIKEGLRHYPAIAGLIGKEVPAEGDNLSGYHVPGGTIVCYSSKAVHHSTALYGPDPYVYRPERWIHTSEGGDEPSREKIKEMERNNSLIFGHGKYECVGRAIALIELNKIFAEFFRRFDFRLNDPSNPWTSVCYGLQFQKGLWVHIRRREGFEAVHA